MEYHFVIRDTAEKAYRTFFWFLFCLHLLLITTAALRFLQQPMLKGAYIAIVFYMALLLHFLFFRKVNHYLRNIRWVVYMLHVAVWLIVAGVAAACIFAAIVFFAERIKSRRTAVTFSPNGLLLQKTLSSVSYPWTELANVVLKDGLLTIDFVNNKLLQLEVEDAEKTSETQFNEYCGLHLTT